MQHKLLFAIAAFFVLELQGSVTDACQDRVANCEDQTDQWCQENPMAPFDCYKTCGHCPVTAIESAINSTTASTPVRVPVSSLRTSVMKANSNSMPAETTEILTNIRVTSAEASTLLSTPITVTTLSSLRNSFLSTAMANTTAVPITSTSEESITDTLDIGMVTGATIGGLAGLAATSGGVYLAASRTICAQKSISSTTGLI